MNTNAPTRPVPYVPAKVLTVVKTAATRKTPTGTPARMVNLSVNETPLGPPREVIAAVERAAADVNRYADTACTDLRAAIAAVEGLDPARLICGNGSEELLDIVGRVYVRAGDDILFPDYSFLQFQIVADRLGAKAVTTPVHSDFTVDLDALAARVSTRTRLIFLASPNNPTGAVIPDAEIARFLSAIPPHITVVIDCAYCEFAPSISFARLVALADERPNVLLTRTMSKAYGLAACRIGWAYGAAEIIAAMNTMRGIGNVNGFAQAAAIAALGATSHLARVLDQAQQMRSYLEKSLSELGLRTVPCETNFCFAEVPPDSPASAAEITDFLAENGYLVRRNEDYGLPNWLRISVGLKPDMERVVALIAQRLEA